MTGPLRAEIAGAGMVGLTAAAALARRGWSVRVHEQNDELRELGAGISIWNNGVNALKDVGAYADVAASGERLARWQLFDERHRLLQDEWLMQGVGESFAVLRTDLHRSLANAALAAGAQIETGSKVAGATADGRLILDDGTELQADLVVGADGVHSRVRDAVGLASAVRDLQDGCGRHLIPRMPEDGSNGIAERWMGGRRIGVMPCSPTTTYVYLCCPAHDLAGRNQSFDLGTWADSFPGAAGVIERIPQGGRWMSFSDSITSSWSRGKVAIVGDAASAMAPNLGQAACVGMTNAVTMAMALELRSPISESLRRWETAQRPVTDATQRYSRMYGWIGTHWPNRALALRSALIWGMAHSAAMQRRVNVAARHELTQPTAMP